MMHMRNFLFFTLLLGGLFSFVITDFANFEENYELLLENSGSYIGADFPKQFGFTGKGIKIGVIDTGINLSHPDFVNQENTSRFSKGYNFVENNTNLQDSNGHGIQITLKAIAPKFNKISPLTGLKRLFSTQSLADFLKSMAKLIIVGIVGYITYRLSDDTSMPWFLWVGLLILLGLHLLHPFQDLVERLGLD